MSIQSINKQAAEITEIAYPMFTGDVGIWQVTGNVGTDGDGYHIFEMQKGTLTTQVPANRLVFVAALVNKMRASEVREDSEG